MRPSNYVHITGNLGGSVETHKSESGIQVSKFNIAETVSRQNPKTGIYETAYTNWVPVSVFGSLAKRAAKSLKTGDRVSVLGTLKTASFEANGEKRRTFEVVAYSIDKAGLLPRSDFLEDVTVDPFESFDEFKESI